MYFVVAALVLPVVTFCTYIFFHFQSKRIDKTQSCSIDFKIYFFKFVLALLGRYRKHKLDKNTKDVRRVQESVLLTQLKLNSGTEYGQRYGFSEITSVAEFQKAHPLTRYGHYEKDIERMMAGETNISTAKQPVIFAVTSGTSGKSNVIPMVRKQQAGFFLDGIAILFHCMKEYFPGTTLVQRSLKFFYDPIQWRMSEAGIKIGPNSSSPSNSRNVLFMYSTPLPAYQIKSEPEAQYIHLLFALKDGNLGMVEANFSSIIYNSFSAMNKLWDDLVKDIETGHLKDSLPIDEKVRNKLNAFLKPDPGRAEELRQARKDGVVGLARRVWPRCNLVIGADSGSFELYADKLRTTFLKDVPIYSPIYAATEGLLGVNIWPRQLPSRYLLIPTVQFFEFVPLENSEEDQPQTLLMDQVKEGESYELVITNLSCLYRYRFGDVVKVAGFCNQCPVVQFLYRQGQFLSVRGEKTSEALFYSALCKTVSDWSDIQLVDYCCAESVLVDGDDVKGDQSTAPCYHVYLELTNGSGVKEVKRMQEMLDKNISSVSYVYSSFRTKGSIGEVNIHLVQEGTFVRLRQFFLENTSASFNQYKVPRVLKTQQAVDFIKSQCL